MKRKNPAVTTHLAVLAMWSAVMAAAALLPTFPVIGSGATFSIANCLVPLAGIFFGPIEGAIAAGVGAFIGHLLAPHTAAFGPFHFTIAMAGALAAGSAMQRRWWVPLGFIALFAGLWYLFPLGRLAWAMPLLYLLGFAAILVGWWISRRENALLSSRRGTLALAIFCTSLAGVVVSQSIGNLWALLLFQLPPEVWFTLLAIAPIERLLFAVGATIIGLPLLLGLPRIGLQVGPAIEAPGEELPVPGPRPGSQ